MPAGKQASMVDGLTGLLGQVATLMAAPDADQQFLTSLQQAIVGHLQQQNQGAQAGPPMGGPPSPQMGPAGGFMASPPPPGGVPGLMQGVGTPNPDELRRTLGLVGAQ